jgi:hypothetical protein
MNAAHLLLRLSRPSGRTITFRLQKRDTESSLRWMSSVVKSQQWKNGPLICEEARAPHRVMRFLTISALSNSAAISFAE